MTAPKAVNIRGLALDKKNSYSQRDKSEFETTLQIIWRVIGLFSIIYTSNFAEGSLHSITLHLQSLSALGRVIEKRHQQIILHLPTIPLLL